MFTIQQRRDHVLLLQTRWVTPLASSTRFNGSGNAALKLAISLSGSHGSPTTAAYSLIPTSLTLLDPSPEEDTVEESVPHAFEEGPEQAALSDILQDGTIGDEDDDEDKSMGEPEYVITWQLPEVPSNISYRASYLSYLIEPSK
jgi:hypothetical protein